MTDENLFSSPTSRVFAATIGVLLTAIVMTAAMPVYLPVNLANKIALPIIFFPVTWLGLFLWALFAKRMWRVWAVLVAATIVHVLLIAMNLGAL